MFRALQAGIGDQGLRREDLGLRVLRRLVVWGL